MDKERNFQETMNHRYSKAIIDFAIKNNAGIIQIENLSSLVEKKRDAEKGDAFYFLKNWPVYSFQQKLKYKADEKGIKIIEIDPAYTSQRCFNCGHIERCNRKTQDKFKCVACGHKDHADRNAARNISLIDIEKLINEKRDVA